MTEISHSDKIVACYDTGMKVFLVCSFADQIDIASGRVVLKYRSFTQYLLDGLREAGFEVACALEDRDWQLAKDPPEVGLAEDIESIDARDVVVAVSDDKPAAGVQFELGYAAAKNKRVILARSSKDALSLFNQGTVGAGLVTHLSYDNVAKLLDQLVVALNAPE